MIENEVTQVSFGVMIQWGQAARGSLYSPGYLLLPAPCLPGKPPLNPHNATHVPPLSEDFPGCSTQSLTLTTSEMLLFQAGTTVNHIYMFS